MTPVDIGTLADTTDRFGPQMTDGDIMDDRLVHTSMRRVLVLAALLMGLAIAFVAAPALLTSPTVSDVAPERPAGEPELIRPTNGESGFWPYLNKRPAFEQRSPINVVVVGETDTVIALLQASAETDWEETPRDEWAADPETYTLINETATNDTAVNGTAINDTGQAENTSTVREIEIRATNITWSPATGATRYAFVDADNGSAGEWVSETTQLHDGTYFGQRYHIRLYESPNPDEPWVAMQTHHEHFDWFTLRHRVHGSQEAQMRLESDLMALPQIDVRTDVSRLYLDNGNAKDADGWATFVDLSMVVVAGMLIGLAQPVHLIDQVARGIDRRLTEVDRARIATARERIMLRHVMLAATVLAVFLGVRAGGIVLEGAGVLSVHGIAAVLYPFIGVGLPVGTVLIARELERRVDAAVVASSALVVAIWLDYALLGVSTLPVDVVVQRMAVVVALGLIAAGAAQSRSADEGAAPFLLLGGLMWVSLLIGTLIGYI